MAEKIPRLVIAGLSGDSGKTIVTLSILAALKRKGLNLSVFKKGPDYIDPAWLSWAAGSDCRNLDTFLINDRDVLMTFGEYASPSGISLIEGNRGIFDGRGDEGKHSTAELAKLLRAPVALVVDCTKTTRTVAAMVKGCINFDPGVNIAGVILNKLAGKRHRAVIVDSIEKYCGIPVLGAIPRFDGEAELIPGRHLGLVTPSEFESGYKLENRLYEIAEKHLDLNEILKRANDAQALDHTAFESNRESYPDVKIGYFKDSVFTFYYPENLEALRERGAELIPVSSLSDSSLPDIDGLYIGGGFPETHADQLSENRPLMDSVKSAAEDRLPIYAECGGLIYLSRSLKWNSRIFPMAGLFDIDLKMSKKPVGHGYVEAEIDRKNPFYTNDAVIKGHEFHYSAPVSDFETDSTCMNIKRGTGIGGNRDGLLYKNCFAAYTHIHARGVPEWANSFVRLAREYMNAKKQIGINENNNNYVEISD
ncbi:MAG: hydrogenobyrinic acid a,c-diamide synthase (glutamine-hydrolyzing) [Candidatus Zixiibacteriota bacterium]|nr:MAG: hydrogenobyrinic acid a,c-diamide synthase (glutamine-hydrolyzing) [candidate division Zixibacteria bacterium]